MPLNKLQPPKRYDLPRDTLLVRAKLGSQIATSQLSNQSTCMLGRGNRERLAGDELIIEYKQCVSF